MHLILMTMAQQYQVKQTHEQRDYCPNCGGKDIGLGMLISWVQCQDCLYCWEPQDSDYYLFT